MEGWDSFFLGHLGASAALAGLLFVAVSLNLSRILSFATLPNRALAALSLLVAILVVSSLMLIPDQSPLVLGIEVLVLGLALIALGFGTARRTLGHPESGSHAKAVADVGLFFIAVIPYVAGAIAMLSSNLPAGVYFIAAAIILSVVKAAIDAWVLLVEINR